jgi:hypothetical protein
MSATSAVEYYRDPAVRARIREYCGAVDDRPPTCTFIALLEPGSLARWEAAPHVSGTFEQALDKGCDVARSMLDAESLIVHVDVDYVESRLAGDALLRPGHAFLRLEPMFRAVRAECTRLDLPLLDLMTGRGYHFTGRVTLDSPVIDRLAELGAPGAERHRPSNGWPDRRRDHATVGLGLLLEYLAHVLVHRAAGVSRVPIVLNGAEVGRGGIGREAISIDLSQFGDPPEIRQLRTAFSTYQNHLLRPDIFGDETARLVPPLAAVPRRDRTLVWMLERARDLEQAQRLAAREQTVLPEVTQGVHRLIDEYAGSRLAQVHRDFYAVTPHPPEAWPDTYDRFDVRSLVACVASPLLKPNDALLKPAAVQHVTRALISQGWQPRHIAGLVRSKYARNFGWGDRWASMDAARRADFDVRVFAGLVLAGADAAVDFNCVSAQEKGLCPRGTCGYDLRVDRGRLLHGVRR